MQDWRRLYDAGIRAVVQLAYEETPTLLPRDFVVCRFPLLDGEDNEPALLRAAVFMVTQLLEQRFATLICCQAGLSRSPAIAAAALTRLTGEPFAVCLDQIGSHHPWKIHPALFTQVQALCTKS